MKIKIILIELMVTEKIKTEMMKKEENVVKTKVMEVQKIRDYQAKYRKKRKNR